jgi:hypothetical protein
MSYFSDEQLAAIIGSPVSKPSYGMPKFCNTKPTAEQMLKKALEFANQGMYEHDDYMNYVDGYIEGKYMAYEDMAAHLEMLIKETKQNG